MTGLQQESNIHNPLDDEGYIHIYTGNGKGKTTAALGLALRAAGAGKKVFLLNLSRQNLIMKCYASGHFYPRSPLKNSGWVVFLSGSHRPKI